MPHANRRRALTDLADGTEAPLTTSELARMMGMSPTFIRSEIKSGQLRAIALGHGRKRVFRIPAQDALTYARKVGML
jgi:excisionase family DNA binding protein